MVCANSLEQKSIAWDWSLGERGAGLPIHYRSVSFGSGRNLTSSGINLSFDESVLQRHVSDGALVGVSSEFLAGVSSVL